MSKQTVTITFGDQAENHIGMDKIGVEKEKGISVKDLEEIQKKFVDMGCKTEMFDLTELVEMDVTEAKLLVIRKGAFQISNVEETRKELFSLVPDKTYWDTRRSKVLNKRARWNLCLSKEKQNPDIESRKGTVIAYSDIPSFQEVYHGLPDYFGKIALGLVGEANYYYDKDKCGIGYHGDGERRIVIAFRYGESMPLHYQWYFGGKRIGKNFRTIIDEGDIYIMSEKAVGRDWKRRVIPTLRHAAGCDKYTK